MVTATKAKTTRPDVNQMVTDQILEMLDAGVVPWRKTWNSNGPVNAVTGKAYRGINRWLLGMAPYSDTRWLTFKGAQAIGASVKKGEKSTLVVFYQFITKGKDTPEEKNFGLLKYYRVFNVEQCENIDESKLKTVTTKEGQENASQELAEAIINGYPNAPTLSHGGDRAFYTPNQDAIKLPNMVDFESSDAYYQASFHEHTHSTGHESRLNRDIRNAFGCGDYSKEELVAEFGSSFLCAHAGITTTIENSAAYIANWKKVLEMDKTMVIQCANKGQKAAEHIMGIVPEY